MIHQLGIFSPGISLHHSAEFHEFAKAQLPRRSAGSFHRQNVATLGMGPWAPVRCLTHLLQPFKKKGVGPNKYHYKRSIGVDYQGYHPKGSNIFPLVFGEGLTLSHLPVDIQIPPNRTFLKRNQKNTSSLGTSSCQGVPIQP